MTVTLNHTIIVARDKDKTATFLTSILGLSGHRRVAHFARVQVGATSLDIVSSGAEITPRHFAFLVDELEFDAILARIENAKLPFWADPLRREPGVINNWDDGRGVYFDDPNGHLLEVLTQPYGSGGKDASHPNPLFSRP